MAIRIQKASTRNAVFIVKRYAKSASQPVPARRASTAVRSDNANFARSILMQRTKSFPKGRQVSLTH